MTRKRLRTMVPKLPKKSTRRRPRAKKAAKSGAYPGINTNLDNGLTPSKPVDLVSDRADLRPIVPKSELPRGDHEVDHDLDAEPPKQVKLAFDNQVVADNEKPFEDMMTPTELVGARDKAVRQAAKEFIKTLEQELVDALTVDPGLPMFEAEMRGLPIDAKHIVLNTLAQQDWKIGYDGENKILIEMPMVQLVAQPPTVQRSTVKPL